MLRNIFIIFIIVMISLIISDDASAEYKWGLEVETGLVIPGYNDVQVPKNTGTRFSLADDFSIDSKVFSRLRLTYALNEKHVLSLLIAPLSLNASGTAMNDLDFNEVVFPVGVAVDGLYRFDSYRVTYRYNLVRKDTFKFGLGFTGKIRSAEISLQTSELQSRKTNTGFVPLVNFKLDWYMSARLIMIIEGDALAAPQGRAEDIFFGMLYNINDRAGIKFGYRFVEGGANVEEVYNFAMINYIVAGMQVKF